MAHLSNISLNWAIYTRQGHCLQLQNGLNPLPTNNKENAKRTVSREVFAPSIRTPWHYLWRYFVNCFEVAQTWQIVWMGDVLLYPWRFKYRRTATWLQSGNWGKEICDKNGFLRNNLQQKWILKKKSATTNEFSAAPNDVNGAHLSRIHLLAQRFQTPTHPLSFKNGNLGSRKYLPISQIIQN